MKFESGSRASHPLTGPLLRFFALVTLFTCLWMASAITRSLADATLEVAGENLRLSLRVTARHLSGEPPEPETIDEALKTFWTLPGDIRWALLEATGERLWESREQPGDDVGKISQELLAQAEEGARVLGKPGRRRVVAAVRLDAGERLVVDYEARQLWLRHSKILWAILLATILATFTAALLLPRRLTRRIEALERKQQTRDEEERALMASLAHDINTPMTVIRGYGEMLHERGEGLDTATREKIGSELLGQSLYVQSMLEDLLALVRARQHGLTLETEPVHLDDLFDSLVDTFQPVASRKGLVLVAEAEGMVVEADPLRLRQILTNLLRNALDHASGATLVEITARTFQREGLPWALLRIDDDGPGVPEDLRPHLFERYRRSTHSQVAGWGLGLAIVRMLSELHGGRCRYQPRTPGARFEVEIPLRKETA